MTKTTDYENAEDIDDLLQFLDVLELGVTVEQQRGVVLVSYPLLGGQNVQKHMQLEKKQNCSGLNEKLFKMLS